MVDGYWKCQRVVLHEILPTRDGYRHLPATQIPKILRKGHHQSCISNQLCSCKCHSERAAQCVVEIGPITSPHAGGGDRIATGIAKSRRRGTVEKCGGKADRRTTQPAKNGFHNCAAIKLPTSVRNDRT